MSDYNILLDTDSYKASHWKQYPPGTTSMFSYIESRGGEYDKTVFFGLQYYIKRYLTQRITSVMVKEAAEFYAAHGVPFNEEGWMHVVHVHGGKLPVRIRAVPEGSVVPTKNILVSIEATGGPETFWVASWLETMLVRVWHPINVATVSWHCKRLILHYLTQTADRPYHEIDFKLHDFGSRGVSSQESAAIGGAAHLVNFMGSDTVVGVHMANKYYDSQMSGFSIPATEHSTITSWGREHEVDAYRNLIAQYAKPGALVACVSDSYDIYKAITELWGGKLKQEVIDSGATLVVRPDSGQPARVVVTCLKMLDAKFGSTLNFKGFKVLNNVKVIQGDGINIDSIANICEAVKSEGFSLTNVAFGMGGALLQQHNRDTQKFAMKCSSVMVNGKEVDVYKDPIDDPGKQSKRGRLDLVRSVAAPPYNGVYETVRIPDGLVEHPDSVMHTVFLNGESMNETTLDEVRERANSWQSK
jgi:nicotinamide phosphoribosyltransferase